MRPARRYTIVVVPDHGRGEVRQWHLHLDDVVRVVGGVSMVVGVLAAAVLLLLSAWPRPADYAALRAENDALRSRLLEIDRQLDEADGSLLRIRLYDAQFRQLRDHPVMPGGFGPLDEEEVAILFEPGHGGADTGMGQEDALAEATDFRPALDWARDVEARVDEIVGLVGEVEPRLEVLSSRAEELFSIRSAFPQVWPVDGVLTSGFGWRRSPINRRRKFHAGLDISAPRGTPIHAVAPGQVVLADWNSGYGRMVAIDHGWGVVSRYAHNNTLLVSEGEYVEAGDVIATLGSTGASTGPHCHFELLIDGRAVDPMDYMP